MGVDKLGWGVRIGFGAGDLAQNLLVSAVGTYLLFFCTDVALDSISLGQPLGEWP